MAKVRAYNYTLVARARATTGQCARAISGADNGNESRDSLSLSRAETRVRRRAWGATVTISYKGRDSFSLCYEDGTLLGLPALGDAAAGQPEEAQPRVRARELAPRGSVLYRPVAHDLRKVHIHVWVSLPTQAD